MVGERSLLQWCGEGSVSRLPDGDGTGSRSSVHELVRADTDRHGCLRPALPPMDGRVLHQSSEGDRRAVAGLLDDVRIDYHEYR